MEVCGQIYVWKNNRWYSLVGHSVAVEKSGNERNLLPDREFNGNSLVV